jgi:hypothetical protein
MRLVDEYIAQRMEGLAFVLEIARSDNIDAVRDERGLSPVGVANLALAVEAYLLGRPGDGDEMASKAYQFLQLSLDLGEKQKNGYIPHLSEGIRSAALSYASWLTGRGMHSAALADAKANFHASFCEDDDELLREHFTYWIPALLYTGSEVTIVEVAEKRFSVGADYESRQKLRGLFGGAVRYSAARSESERQLEKARLRATASRQLFRWIDQGFWSNVAYALHALFPFPEGPPRRQLEECWRHIPERMLARWHVARGR